MSKLAFPLISLALLALGCPAEPDPQESDGGTGSTTDSEGTADTGATGVVDGTGGTGQPVDVPARGVTVRLVELNAGVATAIGRDGQWVPGMDRNAAIVHNRDTVFRVRVDVDEAVWVPRDIEARLTLHLPDGTTEVISGLDTIAGDSPEDDAAVDSGFILDVPAQFMVNLMQFEVELFEVAASGWEDLPEPDPSAPRLPPDGPGFVGVEPAPMVMRVMLVPIEYDGPGCTATFDTSAENLAQYQDAMFQQNPLERLELEVHEPYLVDDLDLADAIDFLELLNRIQQLRAQEAPDPNVYYYGIFDNCAQCVGFGGSSAGCLLGVAGGLPDDSMGSAFERVAIGTSELDAPQTGGLLQVGPETFVHEIGHTQGRQHVTCPGTMAGGPDVDYPHDEGLVGVWGYGVQDGEIRPASDHSDYMSYCRPQWVSDYQWNKTFNRIRTLSSWDAEAMSELDQHAVLVGAVNPETGEARWWTDRGYLTQPTEGHSMRIWAGDEVVEQTPAQVSPWSEGPWVTVRAPLTAAFDEATEIELVDPSRTYRAPRTAVKVYHRADDLKSK